MISYYDLVNFLENLGNEKQDINIIERLNSLKVNLEGNRYYRFLDHLSLMIQVRLNNAFNELVNNEDKIRNDDRLFEDMFKYYTDEVSLCFQIAGINLIHEENQIEVGRIIMNTNNNLLNQLKEEINTDDEDIIRIIDNAYLQENDKSDVEEEEKH